MKLMKLSKDKIPKFGIRIDKKILLLDDIPGFEGLDDLRAMMKSGKFDELLRWYYTIDITEYSQSLHDLSDFSREKLLDNPSKIIGIGLNYVEHANDLTNDLPEQFPVIFLKPTTVLVGHGSPVMLPMISDRVTGEAELGVIFKKDVTHVENWLDAIAGFVCIIDMTAEDILKQNARYLGLSKIFDTFLSIGSELITPDEFTDFGNVEVSTIIHGNVHAINVIANMRFSPEFLIKFLSRVMSMKAGDIVSTGTPRAVEITHGDRIECRISGFLPLFNPVLDWKRMEVN